MGGEEPAIAKAPPPAVVTPAVAMAPATTPVPPAAAVMTPAAAMAALGHRWTGSPDNGAAQRHGEEADAEPLRTVFMGELLWSVLFRTGAR